MCDFPSCDSPEPTVIAWFPIWGAQCGPDEHEEDAFSQNLCRQHFLSAEPGPRGAPYVTMDDTEFGQKLTEDEIRDWFSED